jgi:hypothetical protein
MKVLTLPQFIEKSGVKKQSLINKKYSQNIRELETYVFIDDKPYPVGKKKVYIIKESEEGN